MHYPFYTDKIEACRETPQALPKAPPGNRPDTFLPDKDYLPDAGLVDAVNAALLLRQPLLLTGEPGTGKTQLAYHLACQLGYQVLKFETKSNSNARDLFYIYDALGRFQAAQLAKTIEGRDITKPQEYITYNALGLAILLANERKTVEAFLSSDFDDHIKHLLGDDFDFNKPHRFIVLIDEIDKAPRDFPNDILNEIEKSYFRVPELGKLSHQPIKASDEMQPVLILTSNAEKSLPDAFLRRCIYYNIPFPEEERLRQIVEIRLAAQIGEIASFLTDALTLFYTMRDSGLRKPPATAELLNWLLVLRQMFPNVDNPLVDSTQSKRTFSTLVKTADDQQIAERVLENWQKKQ